MKAKKETVEVKTVFPEDGIFLGQDDRVYRYQITKGKVTAYKKISSTKVIKDEIRNYPHSKTESDYWKTDSSKYVAYFKKKDGSLEMLETCWKHRGGDYAPLVCGDLIFLVKRIEWANTHPYRESTEPSYIVLRAKANRTGYKDITDTICSSAERIVEMHLADNYHLRVGLKNEHNLPHCQNPCNKQVLVKYNIPKTIVYNEAINWQPVSLSEADKKLLKK